MADIRKTLPKGVNDVDMNESGQRSGPLDAYGDPYKLSTVYAILKAWGVVKVWLVNHTDSVLRDGFPTPTREGGPVFMALFPDGKWRYARFGGINGPPWSYCPWGGWEAPNGQAAYLTMVLEIAREKKANLENAVAVVATEVAEITMKLSAAETRPERRDYTWNDPLPK